MVVSIGDVIPPHLDDLRGLASSATTWVRNLVRPGGYITMPTGARMPHLVTDVPTTSNGRVVVLETGEMEVTWSIDPQARWSDGLRVSSSDFAFFDENDYGDVSQTLAVEFVDADPGQIRALFATPTIGYLDAVGRVMPAHLLDPETVCEDSGFDWPSTGAFVIETVDSSRAALVRNEAYWKRDSVTAAQPYLDALEDSSLVFGETAPNGTFDAGMWAWLIGPLLDSVIFRVKPDEGESLEDLLAGALDGLDGKVGNPLSADRLAGLPDGVLVGEAQSGRIVQQLSMQFGDDDDLLQSVLFRQALVYALDTAALAEAEGRPVATGLLEPGGVGPWVQYAQDAATARALVRRACTSAGRDCDNDPPRVDLFYRARNEAAAALIEEMWSDIGVEVRLRLSVPHDGAYAPGGVAIWSYIAGSQGLVGALGMNVVDCYLGSNPNYGRPGGCEPGTLIPAAERLDLLLAEYASTANVDRGREILIQVEQLMADNVMLIPYSWRVASPGAYWEDRVAGIVPNIHGVNTWNIATWYRPDQAEGDES